MTDEERTEFILQLWRDPEFRKEEIKRLRMRNAILANCFTTADVNGLSADDAIKVAVVLLARENEHLSTMVVDATKRALPNPSFK